MDALDKVCSLLPDTFAATECKTMVDQYGPLIISLLPETIAATECKTMVDQYGPLIINLLAQELTPEEVGTCDHAIFNPLNTIVFLWNPYRASFKHVA